MAKRRLTQGMRDRLNRYAAETVAPAAETKALQLAYRKAEPLVRKTVEAKYKPADMAICKKYGLTFNDQCVRLQFPNGVVQQFLFSEAETAPLVADTRSCRNRMYLTDEKTAVAVEAWVDATKALEDERKKRIAAYYALIAGSNYLEDIATVWPEVTALFPPDNAMIALGPDQIEQIKADIRERERLAA